MDIEFDIRDGAITVKENPVYGDAWKDIVTIDSSKITAKIGDTVVEGTYSLKNSENQPKSGAQQCNCC